LVDDLSRLSRDMGGTWQVVFGDLASWGVKVIDITTGMSSDGAGARLTFGAMALVNDTFLQLVRSETHRGLEGRALGGFSTGGRVYGYRTIVEPNPPDPDHPRSVPVIDDAEAETIRRIFSLYADGTGHKRIACILNAEGLRAPYDVEYGKRAGKGWGQRAVPGKMGLEQAQVGARPGEEGEARITTPADGMGDQRVPQARHRDARPLGPGAGEAGEPKGNLEGPGTRRSNGDAVPAFRALALRHLR
jgi:hypothetical protein